MLPFPWSYVSPICTVVVQEQPMVVLQHFHTHILNDEGPMPTHLTSLAIDFEDALPLAPGAMGYMFPVGRSMPQLQVASNLQRW